VSFYSIAQFSVGIKLSGLAFHPQKELNETIYKWKLDKKGKFVSFIAVSFMIDYRFNNYLGVKTTHTIMPYDCAGKLAFVSHIGINFQDRIVGWENEVHRFSSSFGPLLYYRKGWLTIKGYEREETFIKATKNEKWEYKFVWYGAQFQYDYFFKSKQAISINLFPGYPYIYSFAVGNKFVIE